VADQDVAEIKYALSDPTRVLEALGMMGQGKARARQAGGWSVRCPVHEDNSPSCSVQQREGVILWKCHGCGATGDVLTLVAVANNLKLDTQFKSVLAAAARLGGLWHLVDKFEGREPREPRPEFVPPPVRIEPPREWPPKDEVDALWASCVSTSDHADASVYLRGRSLDPEIIDARGLARALPESGALPRWCVCRGGTWREVGYGLVIPVYDVTGEMRSVRVARVVDGEGPKRLPPFGHKASELVMADEFGLAMLRGQIQPYRVVIIEGEPDFLTRASVANDPHGCTLGIVSGSWTKAFADRIHVGARVAIRTHLDDAGDRYAAEITETLRRRTPHVYRRRA
jgi:hypothetical protein